MIELNTHTKCDRCDKRDVPMTCDANSSCRGYIADCPGNHYCNTCTEAIAMSMTVTPTLATEMSEGDEFIDMAQRVRRITSIAPDPHSSDLMIDSHLITGGPYAQCGTDFVHRESSFRKVTRS